MTFPGVAPSPLQAFFEAITVDQLHPLLHPPRLLAKAVVGDEGVDTGGWRLHFERPAHTFTIKAVWRFALKVFFGSIQACQFLVIISRLAL